MQFVFVFVNSMTLSIYAYLWIILSALFFAMGEYLSKQWGIRPTVWLATLIVSVYALSSLLWLPSLLYKNEIAFMGRLWLLLATVASLIVGLAIYQERLTLSQWIGVGLGVIALGFLSY